MGPYLTPMSSQDAPRRSSSRRTLMLIIFALFLAPILARAALYAAGTAPRSWRDADWSSTGALPSAGQPLVRTGLPQPTTS